MKTDRDGFTEIEDRITQLANPGILPGLGRLSCLLSKLGHPERQFRVFHVVGTNGKGSTAAFLSAILQKAGLRTGLYTSPHLVSVGERIRLNGAVVETALWKEELDQIAAALRFWPNGMRYPSFFELMTALSFLMFARLKVDTAVLEAGMGGRLDATTIHPNVEVTVITDIAMDHARYLGNDEKLIAWEKMSVIRRSGKAVFTGGRTLFNDLFRKVCSMRSATGWVLSECTSTVPVKEDVRGTVFDCVTPCRTLEGLEIGMAGRHQIKNCVNAIAAVDMAGTPYSGVSDENILLAAADCFWPGRLEVRTWKGRRVLLDGAHNPHALETLANALRDIDIRPSDVTVVWTMMKDKDIGACVNLIPFLGSRVICAGIPGNPRCFPQNDMAAFIAGRTGIVEVDARDNVLDAMNEATLQEGTILCCGSLYLVGQCRRIMEHE